MGILITTTENKKDLLKARTSKHTLKELVSKVEGKPVLVTDIVVFCAEESVKEYDNDRLDKPKVCLCIEDTYYCGVSDDVVSTALNVAAMEKDLKENGETLFPLSCLVTRTAGKYGKVVMEVD